MNYLIMLPRFTDTRMIYGYALKAKLSLGLGVNLLIPKSARYLTDH